MNRGEHRNFVTVPQGVVVRDHPATDDEVHVRGLAVRLQDQAAGLRAVPVDQRRDQVPNGTPRGQLQFDVLATLHQPGGRDELDPDPQWLTFPPMALPDRNDLLRANLHTTRLPPAQVAFQGLRPRGVDKKTAEPAGRDAWEPTLAGVAPVGCQHHLTILNPNQGFPGTGLDAVALTALNAKPDSDLQAFGQFLLDPDRPVTRLKDARLLVSAGEGTKAAARTTGHLDPQLQAVTSPSIPNSRSFSEVGTPFSSQPRAW